MSHAVNFGQPTVIVGHFSPKSSCDPAEGFQEESVIHVAKDRTGLMCQLLCLLRATGPICTGCSQTLRRPPANRVQFVVYSETLKEVKDGQSCQAAGRLLYLP